MRFAVIALSALAATAQAATTVNTTAQAETVVNGTEFLDPVAVIGSTITATGVDFSGLKKTDGTLTAGVDPEDTTVSATTRRSIKKRSVILTILSTIGTEAVTSLTAAAVEAVVTTIQNIKGWTATREAFTQATALSMWQANPDPTGFPAVACYNKAYTTKNADIDGKASVKLESGVLNTDYDCMYIGKGNAFYTASEGGYINLAYRYTDACTYDGATGDLTC